MTQAKQAIEVIDLTEKQSAQSPAGKVAEQPVAGAEAKEETSTAPAAKGRSRRRATTKKKQYTEDSIRLYLQEIGRIRLLRADEEIELAREIADLLELERIR